MVPSSDAPVSAALPCPLCCAATPAAAIHAASGDYRHCRACDFIFQEPAQRPDRAAERAHYDTHENRVDDPAYRAFLARLADPMTARLAPGAEGLDFGCGPGPALAAMLTERGFPCAGWDPLFAPDDAALARTHAFVTCTEVVEHLHEPARVFALLDGLLAPGGWLGVMTELHPGPAAFAAWYYHRDPTHVAFYSERTMRCVAAHFGWRVDLLEARVVVFQKPA